MTREEAKALADRVLSFSRADQTRVNITSASGGNRRFADASITTSGGTTDVSVTVTATIGRHRASAATNILDEPACGARWSWPLNWPACPRRSELMPELGRKPSRR